MITVLFSPQSQMIKSHLSVLLKKSSFVREGLNECRLDMGKETLLTLAEECSYLPLGVEKKVVIAENFHYLSSDEKQKKLLKGDDKKPLFDVLEELSDDIDLYILVYCNKLDQKCDFYKVLKESGALFQQVSEFNDAQWNTYMERYFKNRGVAIDFEARKELLRRIHGDYATFISEANKLIVYAGDKTLHKEDIEKMTPEPLEDSSFALANALFSNNFAEALKVYRDLRFQGNEPIVLIHSLSTQMRDQSLVNHLFHEGKDEMDCSNILKMNVWRAKRLLQRSSELDEQEFGKQFHNLYECEKNIMTGKMDADEAFEKFIIGFHA